MVTVLRVVLLLNDKFSDARKMPAENTLFAVRFHPLGNGPRALYHTAYVSDDKGL